MTLAASRAASLIVVAFILSTAVASAVWSQESLSINGFIDQNFRFDDGGLRGGDLEGEPSYSSRTGLGLRFTVSEPGLTATLAPGVSAVISNDSEFDTRDLLPRFNGVARYAARPGLSFNANASVTPRFVEEAQFDDTGVTRADVLQLDSRIVLGMTQWLDPRHSFNASVNGRLRTFTENVENLQETSSVGVSAGISRQKSPTTSAGLSVSGRFLDNGGDTQSFNVSASVNGGYTVNPGLSLSGSIGPSLLLRNTDQGGDDTAFGLNLNGSVRYRVDNRTSMSASLAQGFDQRSDGRLENRASLNASLSRSLTSRARVSVSANVGFQNPVFAEEADDRRTYSLSPRFSYALSQDWSLSVSYQLRVREDENDTRLSNGFSIGLSRGLLILP